MLTHKLERLTKLMDKLFDKWVPPMSAEDEAKFQKQCEDHVKHVKDLTLKNPLRFM